jgi:hypothetical protein
LSRGKTKIFGILSADAVSSRLSAAQVKVVPNYVERQGSEAAGCKISPYRAFGGRCGKQWRLFFVLLIFHLLMMKDKDA